jgi:FtsH-binding integral membrane protein
MEINKENICTNCLEPISLNFCQNCGNPTKLERIDRRYAIQEAISLLGFEKGFLYTIKELLLRPGQTIHDYLISNRNKYTKPLTFLLLASAIYTFVVHYFKVESIYQERVEKSYENSSVSSTIILIQNNYGYANIISTVFIIFWLKLFFKKYHYNMYETAVLLFFVMGEVMIFSVLMPINTKYFNSPIIENVVTIAGLVYMGWAIGQFYEKKFSNYTKAFFVYIFGFLTFVIFAVVIGVVYDIIFKGK